MFISRSFIKSKKKCIRAITFSNCLATSTPIFENLNILKIEKLAAQRISLVMFKLNIGEVPKPISELFLVNRLFHNHNTRRIGYLHTPLGRSEASYRTFSYIGTHIWNHIPQNVSINISYSKPRIQYFLPNSIFYIMKHP